LIQLKKVWGGDGRLSRDELLEAAQIAEAAGDENGARLLNS